RQFGPPERLPLPGTRAQIEQSRDGRVLASAQFAGALVLHRDRPGQPIRLAPHADVRAVAVSPDGRWVATGTHNGGQPARVWEANSGKPVKELPGTAFGGCWFSPDGRWLATTGGGCRLWKVGSWEEGPAVARGTTTFHPGLGVVSFSPESKL